jgi:hypothetical protein
MSLTVVFDYPRAKKLHRHWGMVSGNIAFDSSYPTGGELANAANNSISGKFKSCKEILCTPTAGYHFEYDATNNKIKVMQPISLVDGTATAGANNTVVSANSQLELAGTGTALEVKHQEVSNTANLVALTDVRFVAYGTL